MREPSRLARVADLREAISPTPVSAVRVGYRGRVRKLTVKHESLNPSGSVKDRTAAGLLAALDRIRPLVPGTVVVESTSGNLGLGLAAMLRTLDCTLVAVIDPKTPPVTRDALCRAGAVLEEVREPDGMGGYLLTRLDAVRRLCRDNPDYRWTDQYSNPANPAVHRTTTGPELARQGGADLDAVYAAVSSGGTLAGISAHLRRIGRPIRIVAVDSEGSLVTGDSPGERLIPGIGASRRSSFLRPGAYDHAAQIGAVDSVAACRIFRADTEIALGGSSGSALAAYVADLAAEIRIRHGLVLSADGGTKYEATVYDDDWLDRVGIAADVRRGVDRLRAEGLGFQLD